MTQLRRSQRDAFGKNTQGFLIILKNILNLCDLCLPAAGVAPSSRLSVKKKSSPWL
jgi:hypothetical protein